MAEVPLTNSPTNTQTTTTINGLIREQEAMKTVQVFKDDTGTRRVMLDKDGLRTSEPGVDVYDATNDQLTFNSNNNVFKIVASETVTFNKAAGASSGLTQIPHGLGYIPAVIAYYTDSQASSYSSLPAIVFNSTGNVYGYYSFGSDIDNVYFQLLTPNIVGGLFGISVDVTIKYYLLQETAN